MKNLERKHLHEFFMQSPAIMAIVRGPDHVFELANQHYIEMIGNRNPVGKTVREALPEVEGQGFFELLDGVYTTGETVTMKETSIMINRGSDEPEELHLDFSYQAFRNSEGEIEGILVFAYDISEQVRARKLAEESVSKTKFMADTMPQKVWTADSEGNVDFLNRHWLEFTGRDFETLKQWGWVDYIHPDDVEENLRLWKRSVSTGTDFQFEHRLKAKNGDYRWHLSRGAAQKDEEGNILMWMGVNTDVHDLKMVHDKLQQSYEDLEVKVKFRNLDLEKQVKELEEKIEELKKKN